MQEQNINTSGKSGYWLGALAVFILFAGLIVFLNVGKEDELSNEESTEQVLVIPEVETETLENTEQKNYDFAEQLPLYGQEEWKFATQDKPLPELKDSDVEYTQDLLAVSQQLKLSLFKKQQIRKTIFSINDMAQGLRPPAKRLRELSFSEPFSVIEEGGKTYISAQAYHRYDNLAQAVNSINKHVAVALYKNICHFFKLSLQSSLTPIIIRYWIVLKPLPLKYYRLQ